MTTARRIRLWCLWVLLLCTGSLAEAVSLRDPGLPEASRVVVLANSADPDSLLVARHYCSARRIPEGNILALPMPLRETVSWREFVDTLWEPLAAALEREGWIDWVVSGQTDVAGRRVRLTNHHSIAYLVLCRGVPLRVAEDASLQDQPVDQALARQTKLKANCASVDSELAVLPYFRPSLSAFVPNPLFLNQAPTQKDLDSVLRVARLDGPTLQDALQLVDGALQAEGHGLIGTACVDIGGIYPDGDLWFGDAAKVLEEAAWVTLVDRLPTTFPPETQLDRPVLYLGWYATDLNGPFAQPGFRFPPGAIAYHLHSFSAATLRSTTVGWTGPLVARGAAVSFGNVYEPYLALTLRPDLLMRALLRGRSVGEATAYAQPGYSWMGIQVGDPLYRPFRVDLRHQAANMERLDDGERALVRARLNLLRSRH